MAELDFSGFSMWLGFMALRGGFREQRMGCRELVVTMASLAGRMLKDRVWGVCFRNCGLGVQGSARWRLAVQRHLHPPPYSHLSSPPPHIQQPHATTQAPPHTFSNHMQPRNPQLTVKVLTLQTRLCILSLYLYLSLSLS